MMKGAEKGGAKTTAGKPVKKVGGKVVGGGGGRKKEEEEDLEAPLTLNDNKAARIKDEERLKSLKWNFTTPREEFIEQLKTQVGAESLSNGFLLVCSGYYIYTLYFGQITNEQTSFFPQMTGCLSKTLMTNLFHADFKFHLKVRR